MQDYSFELYKYLYEHAPVMYASISPEDGTILKCNQTLCEKLGYEKKEIIGQHVTFVYSDRCTHEVEQAFKKFQDTGYVENEKLILSAKDKTEFIVMLNVSSVRDEERDIVFSRSSWVDITENERNKETILQYSKELEEKNEVLEEFAFATSHDLKEPLRVIGSYLDLIKHKYSDQIPDEAVFFIDRSVGATERLQSLINELLNISKLEFNEGNSVKFNLSELVNEVLLNVEYTIKTSEAKIQVSIDDSIWVRGIRDQIYTVLQNLILNGIKFHKKGKNPLVNISAKPSLDKVIVTIEDEGIGIEEKFRSKVFKPFHRLNTNDEYEGTGLGLSICKRILAYHSQKIWIENGKNGTQFNFTLNIETDD
ncbi:MAG: ATP-binding protein [Flavobacteriales bacterium]|nr:ATP-binding protein [Flavobacteriales bacterium]